MNDKNLHILLSIVERNESLSSLLNEGLSFKQISDLTNGALVEKFIEQKGNTIALTELGRQILSQFRTDMKRLDKDQWIEKENSSRIEKIDLEFIFLPNPNEFFF